MAAILNGGKKDQVDTDSSGNISNFSITNWTEDYDMDCDASADAVISDVLGTLINELIRRGVIEGTVA